MKKLKLIVILLSNMFMINLVIPLFKVLRLNNLIRILVKQANTNIDYVENQIGGNK